MDLKNYIIITSLVCIGLLYSCKKSPSPLFKLLNSSETGVAFENTITETEEFNILKEEYIFNGGGVAISDFNKDGLPDIFFTANMVSNQLFLNKGDLKFKNITEEAQLNSKGIWSTGIAIADVNKDGWMDIYVAVAMNKNNRKNRLYINKGLNKNGVPYFEEQATQYGVDDQGNSMAAAFIDFDNDGDLDLYVVNNEQNKNNPTNYREIIVDGTASSNDRLYKNGGDGTFTDVTLEAGIVIEGFGLSVTPLDINKDQWIDLYITNDYLTNDLLYINQRDGTFKNQIKEYLLHQSKFSMGSDAADFNNDGYTDLISLDMLGTTHERRKTTIAKSSFFEETLNKKWGYQDQHIRNMLFKNNGPNLPFSEIGQFAGIHQTDWSWSPLLFDIDADGYKDLLITNGFPRDVTDMDFANYRLESEPYTPVPKLLEAIPIVKIPNYAFRNMGDLTFEDYSKKWGLNIPSFSNGASLSDLDLDGDLDYVINNINEKAFIFENTLSSNRKKPNYLQLELKGTKQNPNAIGTKIVLRYPDGKFQFHEQQLSRGYMSSVDPLVYFGLGERNEVETIDVLWPNGRVSQLVYPELNKKHLLYQENATKAGQISYPLINKKEELPYKEVSENYQINYYHHENNFQDFFNQRLLPHKISKNGPCLGIGDINNDGLEDFIVGGSFNSSPVIYFQTSSSKFVSKDLFESDLEKEFEIEDLVLFDADNDGDNDLYLVSGGSEKTNKSFTYQDRLMINDGFGNFKLDPSKIPDLKVNGSVVTPCDYDDDGDIDLFVGGNFKPGNFPNAEASYLLENNNGFFSDVTQSLAPDLRKLRMVSDAKWFDINEDGKKDLLVVGEFGPVSIFFNLNGQLKKFTSQVLKDAKGLWRALEIGDLDQDGDPDIILGNFGKNNMYNISPKTPLYLTSNDIDQNGSIDPVIFTTQLNDKGTKDIYPIQFWDNLIQQSPSFRKEFNSYKSFSKANFKHYQKIGFVDLDSLLIVNHDDSKWLENLGNNKFKLRSLPGEIQLGPINDFLFLIEEGKTNIFAVGNEYGGSPFEGKNDALQGSILRTNEKGMLEVFKSNDSGFFVTGDARSIEKVRLKNGKILILVAQNQDKLLVFEKTK